MTLHVRDTGDGPVLVLLHAFPCDGRMWEPQAEAAVAAGWRVLVPDLPGFGASSLPSAVPSLPTVADAVIGMLEERGVERCVVGGVSLGGYVALAMLRERGDLVAGLLLADTKATADTEAARQNREAMALRCIEQPERTASILEEAVLPGLLGDTTRAHRPEVVARVRGWLAQADAATVAWYQRAMAARPDSRDALAATSVPVLVVWGDEDALSPRSEQDLMLEAAPDAALVVIEGAGHLANVEAPDRVSTAVLRLLDLARGPQTS